MRIGMLALLVTLLAACGGDEKGPAGDGSEKSSPGPESDAGPKASAFTKEQLQELADRAIPGWKKHPPKVTDTYAQFSVKREELTEKGMTFSAFVKIATCPDIELCYTLDPENRMNKMWGKQAQEAVTKDAKDGIAELASLELQGGRMALALYTCGFHTWDDGKGKSSNLGMQLRFHDGGNAIRMMISVSGQKDVSTSKELSAYMTRDAALAAAREIFAVYADDFAK